MWVLKNKKWSALNITIFIVMIITIIMLYLLEKIIPWARNVKWIENGNVAYYNANTALEQAQLFINTNSIWSETWVTKSVSSPIWYNLKISALNKILPPPWDWNSDFDNNWNIIAPWKPIQLVFNNWIDWSQVNFYFKVPDISWSSITLSWGASYPIVNWILSWSGKTFFASWSQINASAWEIWSSTWGSYPIVNLSWKTWLDLNWSWWTLAQFYNDSIFWLGINWADCSWYKCTLKLSIVNPLVSTTNQSIPYLEYKIDMWTNPSLPLQYAIINTDGFSYWFKKSIKKEVRQTTTNEALDFTVFQ